MALVGVAFLAAAAAPPAWPLANVETIMAEGVAVGILGEHKPVQEWYQFTAGPPHCDLHNRIDYPESRVIEIVDPSSDTLSKVTFTNTSIGGQRCTTTGPTTFNESQCINTIAVIGSAWNFSLTGKQPCPAPLSTSSCDLWTSTTPTSKMSYSFVSGTARVVQYSIALTGKAPSVITYSKFTVNEPIPASAWQTPSSWLPCMPADEKTR